MVEAAERGDCADPRGHDWVLTEVAVHRRGAEKTFTCQACGAESLQPGQAATDDRPPL